MHILICMGKTYMQKKGAIKMKKYNTAQSVGAPQQDVDDLIFFGQTDVGVSQR